MTEVVNKENAINENIQENNGQNDSNKVKYDNLKIEKNSLNYNTISNPKDKLPLIENRTHQLNNTLNNNRENIFHGSVEVQKKINNLYASTHTFCPPITNYKIRNNLKGVYDVYLRQDNHPDYGNFPYFDDYVEFDPEKYKRPDIYFGYVRDQYIVPHYLGLGNNGKKKGKDDIEKNDEKENEDMKNKSSKIKNKKKINKNNKTNNIKSLDEIMNKYNLKYIEPPPKEKKVEPPPEEVPPEEEEDNKDNKDKNKGKNAKDSANKAKNAKDDKAKTSKPAKK